MVPQILRDIFQEVAFSEFQYVSKIVGGFSLGMLEASFRSKSSTVIAHFIFTVRYGVDALAV